MDDISLHIAARTDNLESIKLLLAKGADPKKQDEGGKTPLHLASSSENKEIAKLLIEKGAGVNVKDKNAFPQKIIRFSLRPLCS